MLHTWSAHFHRENLEIAPGDHFDIGAAAGTQQDQVAQLETLSAAAAARRAGLHVEVESGPGGQGALGGELEAELHRVGHHGAQRADLQSDAVHTTACSVLTHRIDNALRYRHLVHGAPFRRDNATIGPMASTSPGFRSCGDWCEHPAKEFDLIGLDLWIVVDVEVTVGIAAE